jgi:hypothetical protein
LGISVNELKLQLLTSHSTQGNPITYFANWFVRCLIHILVLSGFYVNYSSAAMSVNQGHILINGQVVSNQHATINVGDLITISPTG